MSITGNKYCKFCGDLIDPNKAPFERICGPCFCEKMEEATNARSYKRM